MKTEEGPRVLGAYKRRSGHKRQLRHNFSARANPGSCRNVSAGTGTGEAVGKDPPAVTRLKHKVLIKYKSCSVDERVHTAEEGPRVL